ncbi:unnamed protein product [Peniophora sp. CBMAI 1063]|nr:unnamed protein product [Peniophora sp. CBMAI 1063]
MRFRANIENVTTFARIMQTVEKIQKKCIMRFSETEMRIICNADPSGSTVQIWSTIRVEAIFSSYRIQSNSNNEISILLSADALSQVLRPLTLPGVSLEDVTMKLAKKNDVPVLNFEIATASRGGRTVRVSHDVRIDIMKPQDVAELKEPLCPEPDVHIVLPPLQDIRPVVERLRALGDVVAVRANRSGKLQISAATENAKIDVVWDKLQNPRIGEDGPSQEAPAENPDPERMFGVLLRTRSLLQFLSAHVVSTTTIACVCHQHAMIFYVYVGEVADAGGVLTFFLPPVQD